MVDVCGGENGFNQAIELCGQERQIRPREEVDLFIFEEISRDTGKYCFGIKDTLTALRWGLVRF